jgi:hypothetical protein
MLYRIICPLLAAFVIAACSTPLATDNRPPDTPQQPAPGNNRTGIPVTTDLSWRCVDPDGDVVTWDVYLDASASPTTPLRTNWTTPGISDVTLQPGTRYYWKVVAHDSKGAVTTSDVWSFVTAG